MSQERNERLEGQVALITGASRGIGRAVALRLARDGADVMLVGRTHPTLEEVAEKTQRIGRRALVVAADMGRCADIEAMVKQAVEAFGHVDILVYAAGIAVVETVTHTRDEVWEQILAVNLTGAYRSIREVLTRGKMLERKRGRIIVVASDSGKIGAAGMGAYTASKHGLLGLIRCLAFELGPEGITANAVCPGFVRTQMLEEMEAKFGEIYGIPSGDVEEWLKGWDPQKRISEPEDVADVVAFLASDAARAMTGQSVNVATMVP